MDLSQQSCNFSDGTTFLSDNVINQIAMVKPIEKVPYFSCIIKKNKDEYVCYETIKSPILVNISMNDAKSLISVEYDIKNDELSNVNWVKSNIPGYRSNIIKRVSNNMLPGHISIVYKNIKVRKTRNKASSGRRSNHDLIA